MAKNSITDYDNTAANNTDVQSVDIAEGCSPSGINNAIREVMADLADVNDGTVALTSPQASSLTVTGDLTVDTDTLYVDSTNNRVGIGTTSPAYKFHQHENTSDANYHLFTNSTTGSTSSDGLRIGIDSNENALIWHRENNDLIFATNNTEAMRLDASGNLLVGQSSSAIPGAGNTTTGISVSGQYDAIYASRSSGQPLVLNRNTSDGVIADFRKDGTTVGSIKSVSSNLGFVGSGTVFIERTGYNTALVLGNGTINPGGTDGAFRDNAIDLGFSSARYDDIYATNGTIQTSDENEKQQIASLTSAEITAAKAISKLFKTFKWNDKVEAKGDAARTHTGVIAQHVQTAMTDAGLDAGDYAFFISTDWYVDADGNEVEADAEGAIAKNRKGIRYPELFAFVGAATEQRLADIETRLTALENA